MQTPKIVARQKRLQQDWVDTRDSLVKAYAVLAEKTAQWAARAKTDFHFTELGHMRMYTESIETYQTRLKSITEQIAVLNWVVEE